MPGEVVKHAEALEDLEAQAVFLVESGGTKLAGGFLDAAESAFAGLARMPHIGAPRTWYGSEVPDLRMWPIPGFPNHLIFYRPLARGIEVIRVLHARRDLDGVLDADRVKEGAARAWGMLPQEVAQHFAAA